MTTLQERIVAFVKLGAFLDQFKRAGITKNEGVFNNELFFDEFKHQLKLAEEHNGWFTQDNLLHACESWASALTQDKLGHWLEAYSMTDKPPKTVAIVMAGNIPLVGFHDFVAVILTGNRVLAKLSSNDRQLLPFIAKYLETCQPQLKDMITFTEGQLTDFDLVIATGSDNTARYFDYYFGKFPSIIRRNRNAVAVLTGDESQEDMEALSEDVFRYYGLGCRSVSKLFVPRNYNFDAFFGGNVFAETHHRPIQIRQ